jgi:hypothetical protein
MYILLGCRSFALQPLHCWNILNRIRQDHLCVDPKRWCGVSLLSSYNMQSISIVFLQTLFQVGQHRQSVQLKWWFTESVCGSTELDPLTCLLYRVQALRRRALAGSARLEPLRLGQVCHCCDDQRGISKYANTPGCRQLLETIGA